MAKFAIKVGSNLLVARSNDGEVVNYEFINELTRQIAELKRQGHSILLVTSGAVASDPQLHRSKNLRAAVGWARLVPVYAQCFRENGVNDLAPILVTDHEFKHPETFSATVFEAFDEGVQVVINANDPVNSAELKNLEKCEDNDRLTTVAATILRLDFVLFGIDKPGLMNAQDEVVRLVQGGDYNKVLGYAKGGSQHGHGDEGMRTKLEQMFKLRCFNIATMLLPAKEPDAFLRGANLMLGHEGADFGTIFQ